MRKYMYEDEILGKAFDARLTRKALVFVRPYKKQLIIGLVGMLATSGLGLIFPHLMQVAIDDGMVKKNLKVLTTVALIYTGAYLVRWVFQYAQTLSVSILGQHVIYDIRHRVFSHIQNLSLSFFDKREVGRIISRLTNDVDALNELLTSGALSLLTDVAMVVALVVILLKKNLQLALLVFTLMPLMGLATHIYRHKARRAYRDVRKKIATVTATVAENVSGVRVVKSFSREKENLRRFKEVNRENRDAYMYANMIHAVFSPVIAIISAVGVCMVFWYGGSRVIAGALTVGVLYAFYRYLDQFFVPIRDMTQFYQVMQSAMAGAERIFDVLDTELGVKDKPEAMEMPPIHGDVEFRDVNFAYEETPVLRETSFTAKAGETVALVGPTGAGKTTIVNLLGRQYDIQSGEILIDGHDIRDVTMRSLRSQMGVVLQDAFLFPGSVKENIRYGRLNATDQEVEEAAKIVGAYEFIMEMPEGYETDVREGGTKLSAGQKQLVSFARALLADPGILILDEATSSVDTQTEMVIQEALRKLLKGRTSFVIAHRLSTIVEADKILVIDGGRIVESGRHADLLARGGLYRRLHDMQFDYDLAVEIAGEHRLHRG
jgi:ABC-type multidrug transport system fused ATPase/permease subunit